MDTSGKTFLPWHAEEPNVSKQLVWRIFTRWFGTYCIYMYMLIFQICYTSHKKLFVSCYYYVLCKMSFKIGSVRCVKYIEKQSTQYQPLCGWQCSVPNFEKRGSEKDESLGELKEFIPQIFAWGLTVFLVIKGCKIKYGFEEPISNVDLDLLICCQIT